MDICLRTSPTYALLLTLRAQKKAQKEKAKQNRVHLSTSFCFAPPSNDFQPFIAANKLLLPTSKPSGPICRIQCQLIDSSYYLVISNSVSVFFASPFCIKGGCGRKLGPSHPVILHHDILYKPLVNLFYPKNHRSLEAHPSEQPELI